MSVVEAIQNFTSNFGSYFWTFVQRITNFFNTIIDAVSYVISILKAIWFWLVSLLSWIWDLIVEVFQWDVFVRVNSAFTQLWDYIWWPAVVFLSSLLLLIIFRIWVSFVFKILRLNIDYHSLQSNTKRWNQEDAKSKWK